MISQGLIINAFKSLMLSQNLISISGESGTGKTALAQYLVGHILTDTDPHEECCIWVQASESFPKKRLEKIFEQTPDKVQYLKDNVYIIPKTGRCRSYSELLATLQKLVNSEFLPPDLKFIVVDNISHYLRYEISLIEDFANRNFLLNSFYSKYLLPLMLFCKEEKISLILIHEVSFNPELNKNRPFFSKLYDRLDSLDISLEKNVFLRGKKTMTIAYKDQSKEIAYDLVDSGFSWIK